MSVYSLTSPTKNYAWGSTTGIARVVGRVPTGQPEAELWIGAHPAGSSIMDELGGLPLNVFLKQQPEHLGAGRTTLPYLLKVLAAAAPLSLQTHPDRQQAARGYAAENAAMIPLDAPHRNYKDPDHKPEIIYALTEFFALCGFLHAALLVPRLARFGFLTEGGPLQDKCTAYAAMPNAATLQGVFCALFSLSTADLARVVGVVKVRATRDQAVFVHAQPEAGDVTPLERRFSAHLLRLIEVYGIDPGVLAVVLLHYVELSPGQALYLPAGILHSYLEGVGLELMASSDNVLRGGLTTKHVDVAELLRVLSFEPYEPRTVAQSRVVLPEGAVLTTCRTPESDFALSFVSLAAGQQMRGRGPEILLVLEGKVEVRSAETVHALGQGDHVFCSAEEDYLLAGVGRVARAGCG